MTKYTAKKYKISQEISFLNGEEKYNILENMRKILILLLFLYSFSNIYSQTTIKIINEEKEPIPYANVVFADKGKGTFIKGTVTDNKGKFTLFDLPDQNKKNIIIKLSCIGYIAKEVEYLGVNNSFIVLQHDTKLLDEVVIKGYKQPYKIHQGALVADVKNSKLAKLATVNNILEKLPFVTVQNGNFTIFGKGSPQIYINNRLIRDNSELSLISPKDVKEVKIITTPDSEYNANVGAVIKIKTIRPQGEGFSGTAFSSIEHGKHLQGASSLSLNYRIKNWDLFAGGSYYRPNREYTSNQSQTFNYNQIDFNQTNQQTQQIKSNNFFPEIGINVTPTSKQSLGISYNGVFSSSNLSSYLIIDTQTDRLNRQKQNSLNTNRNHQHIINGYYNLDLGNNIKLNLTGDAVLGGQDLSQHTEIEETTEPIKIKSNSSFDVYAGKAIVDYKPKKGNIRLGCEYTKTKFYQSYLVNQTNLGIENSSDKSIQNRFSSFISYKNKWSDLELSTGVRYELIKGRYFNNDILESEQSPCYSYILPYISLSYTLLGSQLSFSYNPRITYPNYTQLRNFAQYVSPFVYESGNPNLKQNEMHIMQLLLVKNNFRLISSYAININSVYPIMFVMKERPVIMKIYDNINLMRSVNIMASYSLNINFWETTWELGINKQWLNIANLSYKKARLSYKWQNSLQLPKDYILRIDFSGYSKGHDMIAYYKPSYTLNLNLSKSFKNIDANLSLNDILNTGRQQWSINYDSIVWSERKTFDSRNIQLSLSYRFNATNRRYKGYTDNDELNRLH